MDRTCDSRVSSTTLTIQLLIYLNIENNSRSPTILDMSIVALCLLLAPIVRQDGVVLPNSATTLSPVRILTEILNAFKGLMLVK
jgi:hypothetical protein